MDNKTEIPLNAIYTRMLTLGSEKLNKLQNIYNVVSKNENNVNIFI